MLPAALQTVIEEIYADNSFMKLCGLKISGLGFGEAKVSLVLDDKIQTNTNHKVHGGLLMTMMDTATGLAGCTAGKKLVTVSTSINFVKSAKPGDKLEATAKIEQNDAKIYHMNLKLVNKKNDELVAIGKSEMLAIADIPNYHFNKEA